MGITVKVMENGRMVLPVAIRRQLGLEKGTWDRMDLVISTKLHNGGRGDRDSINSIGLSRKHLYEGMKASLERLQLDYVRLPSAAGRSPRRPPSQQLHC